MIVVVIGQKVTVEHIDPNTLAVIVATFDTVEEAAEFVRRGHKLKLDCNLDTLNNPTTQPDQKRGA